MPASNKLQCFHNRDRKQCGPFFMDKVVLAFGRINPPTALTSTNKKRVSPNGNTRFYMFENALQHYSSSSNWNTSLEEARMSYSSLEPTIMFSNSRKPVPAGIR